MIPAPAHFPEVAGSCNQTLHKTWLLACLVLANIGLTETIEGCSRLPGGSPRLLSYNCSIALYCVTLYCIGSHCVTLYYIVLNCVTLSCIVLNCVISFYIVFHCVTLLYILLYCATLCHSVLHCVKLCYILNVEL